MTDIKMGDVFDLPMQQGEHERFLLDANNVYICETEYSNQAKAAKIAINAYDADQKEIMALKAHIELTMNILSTLICEKPSGITSYTSLNVSAQVAAHKISRIITRPQHQCLADVVDEMLNQITSVLTYKNKTMYYKTDLDNDVQKLRNADE